MSDFANYRLGDSVYELANGLVPEIARVFDVELGDQPSDEALGNLVGAIGRSKVLQENIPHVREILGTDQDGLAIAAEWLGRSGVQLALNRSLWTPEIPTPDNAATVMTGAVANWQDRTAKLVADSLNRENVYIAAGNRVMDTPTEKTNANVEQFFAEEDRYPTETEYAGVFVMPVLLASGHAVVIEGYDTPKGDEIAKRFAAEHSNVFRGNVGFARVANAGIQMAAQFVRAAREAGIAYDLDATNPQAYVLTDEFAVAQNEDHTRDPKNYQNPFTGIRQVAVTAKELNSLIS